MIGKRKVLALIPARGGSKGLPGKNLRTIGGVSLVGRAVVHARDFLARAGLADRATLLVDTDGHEIAEEGRRWGARVPRCQPRKCSPSESRMRARGMQCTSRSIWTRSKAGCAPTAIRPSGCEARRRIAPPT